MDSAVIGLIVTGSVLVVVLVVFLIARWYAEKKRRKALVHQDIVERSFIASSSIVCEWFSMNEFMHYF